MGPKPSPLQSFSLSLSFVFVFDFVFVFVIVIVIVGRGVVCLVQRGAMSWELSLPLSSLPSSSVGRGGMPQLQQPPDSPIIAEISHSIGTPR